MRSQVSAIGCRAQHSTAQHSTRFFFRFRSALILPLPFLLTACLFDGGSSVTTPTTGNTAPTVADVSGTVIEDTPKAVTLPGTDADGNALTYAVVTPPLHGAVTVSGGIATYTPTLNYHGADSFTYKANDGTADSATATVSITVTPVNDAPTANAGIDQTVDEGATVNLSGGGADVDTGDTLTYSWVQTGTPSVTLTGANTANVSFTAPSVATDTTLNFTLTVSDGTLTATDAVAVVVRNTTLAPTPTGKLNDTGITLCGDYAFGHAAPNNSNSNVSCALTVDGDNDPIPPTNRTDGAGNATGQDGHVGRDAAVVTNDNTDGSAGFNFTKISSTGAALPASATEWSCVKDNVTGLIWEVKTDDGGLHDKDWTYTWYDTNTATNGGGNGTANGGSCGSPATSQCDTSGFVTAVNTAGWCGASSGWRMPSVTELQSIADLSRNNPSIDTAYFPNTMAGWYWSGTPYASGASLAWLVVFYGGDGNWDNRNFGNAVRLVRSGQ